MSGNDNLLEQMTAMHINKPSSSTDEKYSYKPPVFTDEHRLEKIKNVLPEIKKLYQEQFESNHFPSLVYGLVVDGELIDSNGFGNIDLDQEVPVTSKSLFRIASMSKSFTAMAIVKLRDDGKLRLDDPVYQYVPELKTTDLLTTDAPIITIRHLLIQNVGMPEDDPWADRLLDKPEEEFLAMIKKGFSMSNPPGTIWEYTNLGYAILGRIVTVVSKVPYHEYITKEILHPLGMTNTFWEIDEAPQDLLVKGYDWDDSDYFDIDLLHHGAFGAMGGLISSIEDYSKYMAYHLQAWPARDGPEIGPIKRSSLREMHHPWNFLTLGTYTHRPRPFTCAYCYGVVWIKDNDGVICVNHSGGLPGFGSNWTILPEHGIGLVSFANKTYADMRLINLIILDKMITLADLKPRQLPVSKYLNERKEQIVNVVLEKKWDISDPNISSIFSSNFFLDEPLELRETTSENLFNDAGKIVKIGEVIPKNQLRGRFEIEGENATIQVVFSLTPEIPPLIQELELSKKING